MRIARSSLSGQVEALAEMSGSLADPALEHALRTLLDAVAVTLLPHFDWEDEALFPELGAPTRAPSAGRLLCQQHAQIREGVERLVACQVALRREPTHRQLADLRARLYGLHALLGAHLEQEEGVLIPSLNAATLAETQAREA